MNPRPLEKSILSFIRDNKIATFLQIGVNDGQYADPINLAITLGLLRGTLVEPQPDFFRAAQETYRGIPGLEFVNNAISDKAETISLYTFDRSNRSIPAWLHGSASLKREKVLQAGEQAVPDIEKYLRAVPVQAITVPMLLAKIKIKQPEILVIDAEGYDAVILRQFDLKTCRPKLVVYESEAMSQEERREIDQLFASNGFRLIELGQDSVAIDLSATAQFLPQ